MVHSIPFTSYLSSSLNLRRFNYQQNVRLLAHYHRKSFYSMQNLVKLLIVVLLLACCAFNMKIALEQKLQYEKRAFVYHHSFEKPVKHIESGLPVLNFQKANVEHTIFCLDVTSSKSLLRISVNNNTAYKASEQNGLHVVVIDHHNGALKTSKHFTTFEDFSSALNDVVSFVFGYDDLLILALNGKFSPKNIDETFSNFSLLSRSKTLGQLKSGDTMVFISTGRGVLIAEEHKSVDSFFDNADPVNLNEGIKLSKLHNFKSCNWPQTEENFNRINFCSSYNGYGEICACHRINLFSLEKNDANENYIQIVPINVIASNRPHYLFRCLSSLLKADGVNLDAITVYIDGQYNETYDLAKLFGLSAVYHRPVGIGAARISQHYKHSFTDVLQRHKDAEFVIVVEDDLEVSVDFFKYFNHLMPVLREDESLYCISAWNDHGFQHTSFDPTIFYRVETMPGLGFMMKRSFIENELLPNWPRSKLDWDWDMWVRKVNVRKDRECVIPDVSRTYHFGQKGLHMNDNFFDKYFKNRKLVTNSTVKYQPANQMFLSNYEQLMNELVKKSILANHSLTPCNPEFIPTSAKKYQKVFVAFYRQGSTSVENLKKVFRCLKTWDLDVRGIHKYSFRTFVNGSHVIFVGCPLSPYCSYKPDHVKPIVV